MPKYYGMSMGCRSKTRRPRSQNTWENARYTAQLMKKLGLQKIFLVTDAAHMPRAIYAFDHNGVQPIAAPTGFVYDPRRVIPGSRSCRTVRP